LENDWTLDPAIQSELSDKWYDQPDVVAGIKLNTITVKPKEYERLNEAKRQYPYLQDKDFDYVENLTDDKKAGYLEFWEPGDEGPPDGSVKRPKGIGIDRMGIEVRNPDTRPIDILGDYVSHEAIYSDPKLKDIYDRYTSTLTDKQLKVKYEYEKKNYGEDRPFEQWAERSGKPGMFRGYTFDQFSEDEIKEAYTEEQLKILNEARDYLGVKKLNYEGKDVEIDNQVRNKLYPGEDKYFKENPNVGGMMTEDNKVIINPYSNLTDNEKQAVIKNEKIRLNFKKNNIVPDIDITEEQRALFKGTPYENNEDAMKQTIVARIMTGDPSANATKEQTIVANKTLTQTLLKEKGYTSTAIAGIMANIDVETGGTFSFQEKQRGGKGYGVFQFDFLNPYYQKYLEKSEKKDSLESQIDFMHETVYGNEQDIIGKGNAKKLREGLENAKTPEEAAEIFMNIFEKPGVPHLDRRIKAASKYVSD